MVNISESTQPFKAARILLTIITVSLAMISLALLLLLEIISTPLQGAIHFSLGLLMGVQAIETIKLKKRMYFVLFAIASLTNVLGAALILWLDLLA